MDSPGAARRGLISVMNARHGAAATSRPANALAFWAMNPPVPRTTAERHRRGRRSAVRFGSENQKSRRLFTCGGSRLQSPAMIGPAKSLDGCRRVSSVWAAVSMASRQTSLPAGRRPALQQRFSDRRRRADRMRALLIGAENDRVADS